LGNEELLVDLGRVPLEIQRWWWDAERLGARDEWALKLGTYMRLVTRVNYEGIKWAHFERVMVTGKSEPTYQAKWS
jgi:hypothetical protein